MCMRNPDRIDDVLERMKTCWKKWPDWRFMQLICNFQRAIGQDGFYIEDDKFIEALKTYCEVNEE